MKPMVAVNTDGEVVVHIEHGQFNYATLCGQDGNDDGADQLPAEMPKRAKVTCPQCFAIWEACREFRRTDFAREASR